METCLEFWKLEKIEIGGIKGNVLSSQVIDMFNEYNKLFSVFVDSSYDVLDPDMACEVRQIGNSRLFSFAFKLQLSPQANAITS